MQKLRLQVECEGLWAPWSFHSRVPSSRKTLWVRKCYLCGDEEFDRSVKRPDDDEESIKWIKLS